MCFVQISTDQYGSVRMCTDDYTYPVVNTRSRCMDKKLLHASYGSSTRANQRIRVHLPGCGPARGPVCNRTLVALMKAMVHEHNMMYDERERRRPRADGGGDCRERRDVSDRPRRRLLWRQHREG